MSFISIIDPQTLEKQVRQWKLQNPQLHLPKKLWDCAFDLLLNYTVDDVAKSMGSTPAYLRRKQKKWAKVAPKTRFIQIQPTVEEPPNKTTPEPSQIIQVNIHGRQDLEIELRFQGNVEQLIPLISSLLNEEKLCSR